MMWGVSQQRPNLPFKLLCANHSRSAGLNVIIYLHKLQVSWSQACGGAGGKLHTNDGANGALRPVVGEGIDLVHGLVRADERRVGGRNRACDDGDARIRPVDQRPHHHRRCHAPTCAPNQTLPLLLG